MTAKVCICECLVVRCQHIKRKWAGAVTRVETAAGANQRWHATARPHVSWHVTGPRLEAADARLAVDSFCCSVFRVRGMCYG